MRDRRSSDYTISSTGPDRYFDESLQHPKLDKTSPSSSFSSLINRKSILIPSSFPIEQHSIRFPGIITRPSSVVVAAVEPHHESSSPPSSSPPSSSWHPISKSLRDSPTDSPGSKGTINTSPCTDSDNDDDDYDDDDLDSYCGSLTYSVESFAVGRHFEDIDEGYHAEDEHTAGLGRSCSSLYDDDDDDDDNDDDCFVGHPCSFFFGGIQDWFQTTLRVLSQQISCDEDFEPITLRDRRRRLYPTTGHRF